MKCPKCGAGEKELVFITTIPEIEKFNPIKKGKVIDQKEEDATHDYKVGCKRCDAMFAADVDEKTKKVNIKGELYGLARERKI